jgi:hypothetical protein
MAADTNLAEVVEWRATLGARLRGLLQFGAELRRGPFVNGPLRAFSSSPLWGGVDS